MKRLWLTAAALWLSGCAVGPNYRPPDLTPSAAYRNADQAEVARTADWWRAFNDPVLDRLEAQALANNLDLAAAAARVVQARAAARASGADLLPVSAADIKGARQRSSLEGTNALSKIIPNYPRTGSLYDATAGASWELDLFGGLRRGSEAAGAELEAARAGVAGARLMIAADVADAYIQLRGYQRRLALAERQVALDSQLLELVALRYGAGNASRRELDQAEASLAAAKATPPMLRAGIEAELNRLAVLIGKAPEAARDDLETPGALPIAPRFGAGAPGDMLRRRPDLIAAERRLAAANARIGAAISDYYPKITLQGLLGYESTRTGVLFTGAAQEAQGAIGLRWRLFDFGRVDAEVAAAKGKTAEALAGYRLAALRAAEDVENALSAGLQRRAQASELHRSEAALGRTRQAAQDAYAAGTLSLIEVIDADRALLQVQDQAAISDTEAARAAVALVRALGG
jgi:NodT family efflux transporter outer membrane factor (OMF) lipoprotein